LEDTVWKITKTQCLQQNKEGTV
jgi:hypothetical protein